MRLFEYVVVADRRCDLADQRAAAEWLSTRSFWRDVTAGHWYGWSVVGGFIEWERNIHALRSLAKRVTRRKVRSPQLSDLEADRVLRKHLGRLRVDVPRRRPGQSPTPLSRSEIRYTVIPGPAPSSDLAAQRLDEFWQRVFWSVVADAAERVCEECGVTLPAKTPKGRLSRKRWCAGCIQRRYLGRLGTAGLREKWRREKQAQRQRNRPTAYQPPS